MRPSSCKAKGRRLQDATAKKIRDYFQLPEEDVRPAIMGENGADIKLSKAARGKFPFAVECKNVERLNIWKAWEQAKSNAVVPSHPMLVIKKNHSDTLAIVHFDQMLEILSGLQDETD